MADSKPSSGIDPFPLISKGHVRDRLKVQDIGQGTQEHRHVELIRTVSVPIICIGMDHARCCGYWQPTVRKHDSFSVMSLILDRKKMVSRFLL